MSNAKSRKGSASRKGMKILKQQDQSLNSFCSIFERFERDSNESPILDHFQQKKSDN